MRARRPAGARVADIPVVLPRIVIRPDETGEAYTLTSDDSATSGRVDRGELGAAIARHVDQAGGPVRVEVHEPGGAVYADILQPPSTLPPTSMLGDDGGVLAGGFLPGEQVWVAAVVQAVRADRFGRVRLPLPAPPGATLAQAEALQEYQLILVGAASRTAATRPRPKRRSKRQ